MLDKEMVDYVLMYMIRMGHKNLNYVYCGGYEGNFGLSSNLFVSARVMEEASALKRKWEKETNYIAATGGDSDMGSIASSAAAAHRLGSLHALRRRRQAFNQGHGGFLQRHPALDERKRTGRRMGHWNQDVRREDGHLHAGSARRMFAKLPQPLITAYQYKVRE